MSNDPPSASAVSRFPFVDALRAVVATLIAWHHFMLYGPLAQSVPQGPVVDWLRNCRWVVQVFFVISGYVLALSMSRYTWNCRSVGAFAVRRYSRLGLPYLATVALAISACAVGRGWLSPSVVGPTPTLDQILAHVAFLQDILGYESLSAGLWFVCINFQLGLLYVFLLYLRDGFARLRGRAAGEPATAVLMLLGWGLAVPSLFVFNVDSRWDVWAIYYFGQFFLGVMVHQGLSHRDWQRMFWVYLATMAVALVYGWRWRLAMSMIVGLTLFLAGQLGLLQRWPASRVVAYLGRTSYSLFLVHFPVLIVVSTVWVRFGWTSVSQSMFGLIVAYLASLAVADVFYRFVEAPAARLSRRLI